MKIQTVNVIHFISVNNVKNIMYQIVLLIKGQSGQIVRRF